jgi:hypothetical protein
VIAPVRRVDLESPALTDANGTTWYRSADGWGWTAQAAFAHPSYFLTSFSSRFVSMLQMLQNATPSREENK